MQKLWITNLVVWINLWLRGGILPMCREYKTLWKPNLKHYCPAFYDVPGLLWLVSHGRHRSPGYRRLKPRLRDACVLQWVVLNAGYFSVECRVNIPTTFVSLLRKPSSQAHVVWWFHQFSGSILRSSLLLCGSESCCFPCCTIIGDSASESIRHTSSDR